MAEERRSPDRNPAGSERPVPPRDRHSEPPQEPDPHTEGPHAPDAHSREHVEGRPHGEPGPVDPRGPEAGEGDGGPVRGDYDPARNAAREPNADPAREPGYDPGREAVRAREPGYTREPHEAPRAGPSGPSMLGIAVALMVIVAVLLGLWWYTQQDGVTVPPAAEEEIDIDVEIDPPPTRVEPEPPADPRPSPDAESETEPIPDTDAGTPPDADSGS